MRRVRTGPACLASCQSLLCVDPTPAITATGHDPSLVYDPIRDCFETLSGTELPLGISGKGVFDAHYAGGFSPGTVIAVGTDGIWKARGVDGHMFGKERLKRSSVGRPAHPAGAIPEAVYRE